MICSESTANIFKAFSLFQAAVTGPAKNGKGNYGAYVLLDDLVLLRKSLSEFGLSFTQSTTSNNEGIGVETTIMHESGEWFSSDLLLLPMEKRTPQGAGGAVTYGRRYSLAAALGVASESDDDAQHAEDLQHPASNTRSPAVPAKAPVSAPEAATAPQAAKTGASAKPASKAQIAALKGFISDLGYTADDARAVIHEHSGRDDATTANMTHREAEDVLAYLMPIHAKYAEDKTAAVVAELGAEVIA